MYEEKCYEMILENMPPEYLAGWNSIPEYSVGIFQNHEILQEMLEHYHWAHEVVKHHNSRDKLDSFAVIQHDQLILVFADRFTSDVGLRRLLEDTEAKIDVLRSDERMAAA